VIARSVFLRLLPALTALLLFSAQPAGRNQPAQHDAAVASHERDAAAPRAADWVTRKQRHAATLEEFFAIDDDSDQFAKPPLSLVAPALDGFTQIDERERAARYREARPNHRACAAPPTGPPHA
jgi:hypothetical protein